jgi:hypothetical protein
MAPAPENDARAGAILWLKNEPLDNRLVDASFGRYAYCWWNLRFQREAKNGEVQDSHQDDEKRVLMVIEAWTQAFAPEPAEEAVR